MVKNPGLLEEFERECIRKTKVDIKQNFRIANALYREAVALGVLPPKDPLEGIELKIKIAKVVNNV